MLENSEVLQCDCGGAFTLLEFGAVTDSPGLRLKCDKCGNHQDPIPVVTEPNPEDMPGIHINVEGKVGKLEGFNHLDQWASDNVAAWQQAARHASAAHLSYEDKLKLQLASLLTLHVVREKQVQRLMEESKSPLLPWTPTER